MMFFNHKKRKDQKSGSKSEPKESQDSHTKRSTSDDNDKKRPAILMHGAEERHAQQHKTSSERKGSDDKKKVSLFDQRSSKEKDEHRRTDELVANFQARRFNHKVIDLLGYKGLTHDKHHYLRLSNSAIDGSSADVHEAKYAEILRIGGTGIENLPESMVQHLLSDYVSFWRTYLKDVTCICLPLPNDSKDQQHAWQNQIDKENDQLMAGNYSSRVREQMLARKKLMQENLGTLRSVDQYLINQGFALLVFAKTERELTSNVTNAMQFSQLSLNLSRMTVQEKEDLLKRINNPAMML